MYNNAGGEEVSDVAEMYRNRVGAVIFEWFLAQNYYFAGYDGGYEADIDGTFDFRLLADAIRESSEVKKP